MASGASARAAAAAEAAARRAAEAHAAALSAARRRAADGRLAASSLSDELSAALGDGEAVEAAAPFQSSFRAVETAVVIPAVETAVETASVGTQTAVEVDFVGLAVRGKRALEPTEDMCVACGRRREANARIGELQGMVALRDNQVAKLVALARALGGRLNRAATLLRQSAALDAARAHALSRTRPATVNMELFNAGGGRAVGGRAPTVAPKRRSKSPRRAAADAAADATAATAAAPAPAPAAAASSPVASRPTSPIDGIDGVGVAGGSGVDERRACRRRCRPCRWWWRRRRWRRRRSDPLGRCRHGLRPPGERRHGGGGGERGDGRRAAAFGATATAARRRRSRRSVDRRTPRFASRRRQRPPASRAGGDPRCDRRL